jgi:lantibiotic modifying enzyme
MQLRSLLLIAGLLIQLCAAAQDQYFAAVLKAEKGLKALQQQSEYGYYWPNVKDSSASSAELYSGNSGIVLFYLELHKATGKKTYLQTAEKGIQHIIAIPPKKKNAENIGLYTGIAGIVYPLHQLYAATKNEAYLKKANQLLNELSEAIKEDGASAEIANDIVYGYAGIGLVYLYAAKYNIHPAAMDVAKQIGDILLKRKLAAQVGSRWPMFTKDTARNFFMPNFSHGTSGVAYYLACLYEQTKEKKYIDAVLEATNHLQSIASKDGFIYHAEPNEAAMSRYYVSWCHGPAGTARLYYKLFQLTGDQKWKTNIALVAQSLIKCGIPEKPTTGYWNNVSYCCGNAGIAEFYITLYKVYGNKTYLEFGRHMLDDLVKRSTSVKGSFYWNQAENRTQPTNLQTQTGLMQGSAGIALTLLHTWMVTKGKDYLVRLPDNPF